MDFESLKTSSSGFDKLTKALEENLNPDIQKTKTNTKMTDCEKPELDKTGNGYAVLRFLPATSVKICHGLDYGLMHFKDQVVGILKTSLTTLGHKDPVSEENTRLWNTGVESDKGIARNRKRKLSYYSNVLIVSDPAHPENEGQVKLFKFGKKIFDKITEAMQPEFDDETPINPFDFWKGANFKLKIRKVDGFWNYDKSEFEGVSAIADNDDSIKAIWEKQYPLKPFLDADNFKSYEELKEKLNRVITGTKSTDTVENVDLPSTSTGTVQSKDSASIFSASDSDDTLDYFSKLAEE